VLDQLADPHRVGHIRLAARHVAQVPRVEQPAPEVVFQQVLDRPPIHPGDSIPTTVTPKLASQSPSSTSPAVVAETTVSAAADPRLVRDPDGGGDAGLVHVQTGATLDE
jgi:hypothetical protein